MRNLINLYERILKENQDGIPINIWDDYYDDGFVPKGERQETHLYVEDSDMPREEKHKIMLYLYEIINKFDFLNDVDIRITKEGGTKDRYVIEFTDLTHIKRKQLLKTLKHLKLKLDDNKFKFYSDS